MILRPRDCACAALILIALATGGPVMAKKTPAYSIDKKSTDGYITYHLHDTARKMDLSIVPGIGLLAYELKVNGKDVFVLPESLPAYVKKRWFGAGNPLMAPFANRIDKDYYFIDGKKYLLNDTLGNTQRVPPNNYILHGLLVYEPRWEVVKASASWTEGALLTARLDFYKYPDLMANFPFAHSYEINYRLKDGKLECRTKVTNLGSVRMPGHFGYHPYFVVDGPREEWTLGMGARKHWPTERELIPIGKTEATEEFLPGAAGGVALGRRFLDNTFSDFERDAQGLGHTWVKGRTQKIEVIYSREYDFTLVYAPLDQNLICLEPETGPTNGFNLAHEARFDGLLMIEPGQSLEATFWVVPTGY